MARPSLDSIYNQTTTATKRPSLDDLYGGGSSNRVTTEPEEIKKNFMDRLHMGTAFQSSAEDGPIKAAFKTIGNLPGSTVNFGVGVAKFLNPIDKLRDIAKLPGEIKKTTKDVGSLAESEAGLSFQTNQLIEQIRKNREQGKDNTRLIAQLRTNGINVSPDLEKDLSPTTLRQESIKAIVPEAAQKITAALDAYSKGDPNKGDTLLQDAQRAIVEDPTGQIAPFLLVAKQTADSAGYGKQFNAGMERAASIVTKPTKAVITKTQNLISTMTRYGTAQATGLNPKTINTILENQAEFATENAAKYTRENIAKDVHGTITDRVTELRSTGKGYETIRQQPGKVILPENITEGVLKKYGLKLDPQGNIVRTSESVPLKTGDIAALEAFYKQYGKEKVLSNNGFLNTRQALDQLSEWDVTKSDVSNRIARDLRTAYDELGKQQVEGLEVLDAKYAPEVSILKRIKSDYLQPDGSFKDGAISKIANLTGKGKEAVLGRLEQIKPGITKEITILNAIEDIHAASGQKVGTYGRAALSGGGFMAGIITGNPFLIAGSILEAILSQPQNATAILRGYARLRGMKDAAIDPIVDGLKKINEFNVKGKDLNIGATIENVSTKTVPASRFFGKNADIKPLQADVDPAGVNIYRIRIREGERPPVTIETNPKTGETVITDGHTRLEAYRQLGEKNIPVIDNSTKVLYRGDNTSEIRKNRAGEIDFTTDKSVAKEFADKYGSSGVINEVNLKPNAKILDANNFSKEIQKEIQEYAELSGRKNISESDIVDFAKDNKYDAIDFSSLPKKGASYQSEFKILNPDIISPIPKAGSVEAAGEAAGGWKPGMKAEFDMAILHKDAATITRLLPQVPEAYKKTFKKNIEDALTGD